MNDSTAIHAGRQTQAVNRRRVEATVTVQRSKAEPYDRGNGPTLVDIQMTEAFNGSLQGASTVRALQLKHGNGSASMVSLQRFRGTLGGRRGAFVLQGAETVRDGRVNATWFVVPGSATGELVGLRGEGGFSGAFGKGSAATLDYWFE